MVPLALVPCVQSGQWKKSALNTNRLPPIFLLTLRRRIIWRLTLTVAFPPSLMATWSVGPQQGRKAFMIRTIRPLDRPDPGLERVAKANGFSLHAGVNCEGHQKNKRERLCRYIARPAVAVPRLSLSSTGKVLYTLKTPYPDGTTRVAFDPVDFMARLAALVPKPRVNLTRYHGVLAPARPDRTRPDRTRPDRTRPDRTRPDRTRPDRTTDGVGWSLQPNAAKV